MAKRKNLLTNSFLSKYPDFPEHMNELGKFVFYRTYSRWIPELKRRETWKETVARAVNYNTGLAPTPKKEAEALFHNIFNLKQALAGRTFWVGGTEVSYKYPMANFNCSFIVMDDLVKFKELFYLLMLGTGVGFRILFEDVDKLPRFRQGVKVSHRMYQAVPKSKRQERSSLKSIGTTVVLTVGDSKEGWSEAIDLYFKVLTDAKYASVTEVIFNYDNVRPKGERLNTFGGFASGHESVKRMFEKIEKVINTDEFAPKPVNGKLRPIHVLDIGNIIGENVVVGGVRRTAEIALGDMDDEEFLYAKSNLTPDKFHRFMSNNSIYYDRKPTREQIGKQFAVLKDGGEPCYVNAVAAKKRRSDFKGVNPCVEILLADRGLCNLTTVNVLAFVKDGKLDLEGLLEAQRLSARAGYRMTCVELELEEWNNQQKKDRLCGVSMTGWEDAIEALGYNRIQSNVLKKEMHAAARNAADEYVKELGEGYSKSLLVTAVKPEGTISQIFGGVSQGVHVAHSPYHIRRIRINADDPLCKAVEDMGWTVHNEVGQGEDGVPVTTKVIDFPIASPAKRTKYDVSAAEQLESYFDFQKYYTEHNASNTITVKDYEWGIVEEIVANRWDDMLAVSFLKLDGHTYKLAPYEAITKEQYEEMRSKMPAFDESILHKYESGEDFDLNDDSCSTGACPIR